MPVVRGEKMSEALRGLKIQTGYGDSVSEGGDTLGEFDGVRDS